MEGTPNTRPTRSTLAHVSYRLLLVDNLTSTARLIEEVNNEQFFVSEYDILAAIDIAVQVMNRGERALIESQVRHCFGDEGCEEKQVPPLSSNNTYRMRIELELHDWNTAPDVQTLSVDERLSWG